MNALHFHKLNPHFKFNKIFLYNQAGFNKDGNIIKYFFPLNHGNSNYLEELKEPKKLDYNTQNLLSKYTNEIHKNNNINGRNSIIPSLKKNFKMKRPIFLQSSNLLKKIDFNLNVSDDLNDNKELNINPFSSGRKNIERSFSIKNRNNMYNIIETNNNVDNKKNKNIHTLLNIENIKKDNLNLPFINNKKNRNNNTSLNNINEKKLKNKTVETTNYNNNFEKNINNSNSNENNNDDTQKDFFQNVSSIIDNKKTQLNVNDIQRSIDDIKNFNEDIDIDNNFESKIFINTRLPKSNKKKINLDIFNDDNLNSDNSMSDEMLKRKEKDKYMLYEKNKKFIEKKKIYNSMKYRASIIPNLNLDKDFRKIKNFESIISKIKRKQIDLPCFTKNNK